jgi:lipoate-protein ligase B
LSNPVRLFRFSPGYVAYNAAWCWQLTTAAEVRNGAPEALALLEHTPVFTFGRRPRYDHLVTEPADLRSRGAAIVESDRGGDITFHGPGQLVVYPILDLRTRCLGPSAYVRSLEEAIIQTLLRFRVRGARSPGRPGVWVDGAKVAAIGVRVHAGVSTHGLALNVATDLSWFRAIVPCGISDAGVTSLARLVDCCTDMSAVMDAFCEAFAAVFDSELLPETVILRPQAEESVASTMGVRTLHCTQDAISPHVLSMTSDAYGD